MKNFIEEESLTAINNYAGCYIHIMQRTFGIINPYFPNT